MERAKALNPFARRESHDKNQLMVYKIFTITTWVLVVVVSIACSFSSPGRRSIWEQNKVHPTPFSLNPVITDLYWIALLLLQLGYVWHLFSSDADLANAAANVGSHFIINNLLQFAFVLLWVHSRFWIAEAVLILNFFNLISLYLRYSTTPRFVHIPVVSGPLAWTFVAILWNGAAMVGAHSVPARILANIVIWAILVFGLLFLVAFKDYTMGFALSILAAAIAVHQLGIKVIAFQWIFAFVVMSVLFLATLAIAIPGAFGKELRFRQEGDVVDRDRERQPLLDDE
jgi:heme/copper-type cytochrome/quinol oxidase subunit 2